METLLLIFDFRQSQSPMKLKVVRRQLIITFWTMKVEVLKLQ
jgi:hypothetical protein